MLSELVFEQIEGNFWYAAYGPFRVIMMKDNGYINATKLCSSGGRKYKEWVKTKSSKELIQALEHQMVLENTYVSAENSNLPLENTEGRILPSVISAYKKVNTGLPVENTEGRILPSVISAYKKVNTGNKTEIDYIISGTCCHPDLIPHIACLVSPEFALMVSKVINGYITQEYKSKLGAMQLQLEQATELREAATLDAYNAQQLREAATQDAHHAHLLRDDAILVAHQANQQVKHKEHQIQQKEHFHQV